MHTTPRVLALRVPRRRGFLFASLALAGGAIAVVAGRSAAASASPWRATPASTAGGEQGYRETAHVRAYYHSTRG